MYHACIAPWFLKAVVHVRQCHSAWLLSVGTKTILDSPFASPAAPLPRTFSFLDIWPRNDFLTKQEKTLIKHCQRHNGPKALRTLTQLTLFFQSRGFYNLWNLGQASAWFCLAIGKKWEWHSDLQGKAMIGLRSDTNTYAISYSSAKDCPNPSQGSSSWHTSTSNGILPFRLPLPCVKLLPTSCQTVKWQGLAAKLGIP